MSSFYPNIMIPRHEKHMGKTLAKHGHGFAEDPLVLRDITGH